VSLQVKYIQYRNIGDTQRNYLSKLRKYLIRNQQIPKDCNKELLYTLRAIVMRTFRDHKKSNKQEKIKKIQTIKNKKHIYRTH